MERFFLQEKTGSEVHHWKWVKNKGLFVAMGQFPKVYQKSDYTLKELLSGHNGESPRELSHREDLND